MTFHDTYGFTYTTAVGALRLAKVSQKGFLHVVLQMLSDTIGPWCSFLTIDLVFHISSQIGLDSFHLVALNCPGRRFCLEENGFNFLTSET